MTLHNITRGNRTFPFFIKKDKWDGKESPYLYVEVLYIMPSGRAVAGITYHFDGKTTEDLWTGIYPGWVEVKPKELETLKKSYEAAKLRLYGEDEETDE